LCYVDYSPEATKYLKAFIGDHYAYADKPALRALWESYNFCQFVENEGKKNEDSLLKSWSKALT
jgi:hypothetical protein